MKRDYPERPIVAVGVVVIKDDQVLLIRRSKPPRSDSWSIPGGAQELGETTQQAGVREVLEETAITVRDLHFFEVIDLIEHDNSGAVEHHYTLIDYAARYYSGTPLAGDDAHDAKWVPLDDLSEYTLWEETTKIIDRAVEKLRNAP